MGRKNQGVHVGHVFLSSLKVGHQRNGTSWWLIKNIHSTRGHAIYQQRICPRTSRDPRDPKSLPPLHPVPGCLAFTNQNGGKNNWQSWSNSFAFSKVRNASNVVNIYINEALGVLSFSCSLSIAVYDDVMLCFGTKSVRSKQLMP